LLATTAKTVFITRNVRFWQVFLAQATDSQQSGG
jgi:hypothetical protein